MATQIVRWLAALLAVIGALLTVGCASEPAPKMTDQEMQNFKGGPMPESARKIMQEKLSQAAKQTASNSNKDAGRR